MFSKSVAGAGDYTPAAEYSGNAHVGKLLVKIANAG
jgi:hypothetical protein